MNIFTGITMLILACGSFLFFRPEFLSSRVLCAMTGAMGLMAFSAGAGSWGFQLLQTVLEAVVAFCCVMQIRREAIVRARRAARRRARHPAPEPQRKAKTCA